MTVWAIRTRINPTNAHTAGEWWYVKRADGAMLTMIPSRAWPTTDAALAQQVRGELAAKMPGSEFEVVDLWAKRPAP